MVSYICVYNSIFILDYYLLFRQCIIFLILLLKSWIDISITLRNLKFKNYSTKTFQYLLDNNETNRINVEKNVERNEERVSLQQYASGVRMSGHSPV